MRRKSETDSLTTTTLGENNEQSHDDSTGMQGHVSVAHNDLALAAAG